MILRGLLHGDDILGLWSGLRVILCHKIYFMKNNLDLEKTTPQVMP